MHGMRDSVIKFSNSTIGGNSSRAAPRRAASIVRARVPYGAAVSGSYVRGRRIMRLSQHFIKKFPPRRG